MKIKQYPGRVIMEDPWMSIGDRTMEMVYAANWVDTHRNLVESQSSSSASWNSSEENLHKKPPSNVSRSKSCRDVARPQLKVHDAKEYSLDDSKLNGNDENISQLAKYQQHIEEQTRASKEFLSSRRQLQPSFSFKGLNGYKPSTLRRIKRKQFKEWDVEEHNDFPVILPNVEKHSKKDSLKYLQRQRKHDSVQFTPPCPPSADPSFYEYYSRISQQEESEASQNLLDNKKKVVQSERPVPAPRISAPNKKHDNLNGSTHSNDSFDFGRYSDLSISSVNDSEPEEKGTVKCVDNEERFYGNFHGNQVNGTKPPKPAVRSKSLRVNGDCKPSLLRKDVEERFSFDDTLDPMAHEVTVTQPKRTISPIEQLNRLHSINGSKFNTVRVKSNKSSSSGDSDSDFSIPRPKLIVPVHTYGIRKRRTGNLAQRESVALSPVSHQNGFAEDSSGELFFIKFQGSRPVSGGERRFCDLQRDIFSLCIRLVFRNVFNCGRYIGYQ